VASISGVEPLDLVEAVLEAMSADDSSDDDEDEQEL